MILSSIELENYKQYAGPHTIDFPEQGIVAITGPNGAGKTTLFEAIEWCLYGPRTIPLGDIPPHGGVGQTRVRVTLQDPHDGRRYVVQRSLRRGVTAAEAFAEDDPGQPLVQGPRDVTDYVGRQLIGLPHAAFVSTFFTRQKELTFFGERGQTERRVEVARLLGFQTVRDAQDEIGNERNLARQTANALIARKAQDSEGRDFGAEIESAAVDLRLARDREVETAEAAERAEVTSERARTTLDGWRELQDQDFRLATKMADIAGQTATATSQRDAAGAELARLDERAVERAALVPDAETVAALVFEVSLLDEQRRRAELLRALEAKKTAAADRLEQISERTRRLVLDHQGDAADVSGWSWNGTDRARPEDGIARLSRAASALDAPGARAWVDLMRQAFVAAETATDKARLCERFQQLHDRLSLQRVALFAAGEPEVAIVAAQEAARRAQEAIVAAKEALARLGKSREDATRLARELRDRAQEPICPTCARPLGAAEAERLARLLDAEIEEIGKTERAAKCDAEQAANQVQIAERTETEARQRQGDLATLDARLADGQDKMADAAAEHERALLGLQVALRALAAPTAPLEAEIEAARLAAERLQRVAGLAPLLAQLGDQSCEARRELVEAEDGVAELGPVSFDATAHKSAQSGLDRARDAAARMEQIDKELASRPRYEEMRNRSEQTLDTLAEKGTALQRERQALGFDPDQLRGAQVEESLARAAARAAREESAQARETLRDARTAHDRVVEERDRLLKLAEEADRRVREADDVERMYREFAEFDKYVADHVGPLLAETTERLLSLVTHGKYDRVRFDVNYGIEVYDGDESFKLEGFSGGERDVVSLCARLAMSELVGSAALRPPRFLVLDEVFGSLDSERRAQLLETLGSLASSGHFQQMFIISHVDDVQQSPVMNEAWTIEERAGVSQVIRPEILSPAMA